MLVVELNEYNSKLLRQIADRLSLGGLKEIFGWNVTKSLTDDEYDSGYLEPWVQWVSVHTGTPSSDHKIKNLGDVPSLGKEQLWERWSRQNRHSVVWGVMNGARASAKNCDVFIPDPWAFSEPAYPDKYRGLIELPRYLATHYLEISKFKSIKSGLSLLRTLMKNTDRSDFVDSLRFLFEGLRKFGTAHFVFIVFFEHVSSMAFLRALKKVRPDDAVLFINMMAHAQHHYWYDPDGVSCPEIEFAAKAVNDILEKLLARAPEQLQQKTCIMNGLTQKNTNAEPAWILHRPKSPEKFVEYLGLQPVRVEPLMTHDAHLKFDSPEKADNAYQVLSAVRINGKQLFYTEKNRTDPNSIFYRLDFFGVVTDETMFVHGNNISRFKDHFTSIVKRTGKHIPEGEIMVNWPGLPSELYNHEFGNILADSAATEDFNAPPVIIATHA